MSCQGQLLSIAQNPNNRCLASDTSIYADEDPVAHRQMSPTCITSTTTVAVNPTGSSQPFSILQPFLVMNYGVCTEGLFPTRN